MYKNKKIIAIIPGRGGSKGIPRKNVRLLNKNPLISYVINTAKASEFIDDVVVTTDDDEIESIAKKLGVNTIKRSGKLAKDDVTIDPVIFDALNRYEKEKQCNYDYVITIQPTSPLLKVDTLNNGIKKIINENSDNLISVVNDSHLNWGYDEENRKYYPLYEKRVNRQYLPKSFKETGAIFIGKSEFISENSRLGNNINLLEMSVEESIDIDSYLDWWVAEKLINRKKIIIKTDASKKIGTGHVHRGLSIASKLTDHKVIFLLDENKPLGIEIVKNYNYPYITHDENNLIKIISNFSPDIVINDFLNTTKNYIKELKNKNYFVVNFEDIGEGSKYADIVFDALNEHRIPRKNLYSGHKYYILRNEFLYYNPHRKINKEVKNILITFGGTDPNDLTRKILYSLSKSNYKNNITVILGLGCTDKKGIIEEFNSYDNIEIFEDVKNISEYMYNSDLVFTSAGRTMYEVASLAIPCICLCQNKRELTHLFGNAENGLINLGLGNEISEKEIVSCISNVLNNYDLRCEMNKRMKTIDLTNGFDNIINLITSHYNNYKSNMSKKLED
jgi:CMP-N-acetylneuraminic acid synthetase/spore coat polysaccharide biosynthesis predicted glycosyltransferase SpsG